MFDPNKSGNKTMDCPEGYVHKGEQGPTIVTEVGVFPALWCDENITLYFKGSVTASQGEKQKRNYSLMLPHWT